MLQTPYCPRDLIRSEFYIPGTEPMVECDKHTVYGPGSPGYLDTLGRAADTFSRTPAAAPLPPPPPQVRVVPGASPVPRAARPRQDTSHSRTVFDTVTRPRPRAVPARTDTNNLDSLRRPRPR
jgi:hypothetical protein